MDNQSAKRAPRIDVWILIAVASFGGAIFGVFILLRALTLFGGPGIALYDIPSRAMFPTLMVGDRIFALGNVFTNREPPRGQVLIFKFPADRETDYVKRVVGLPGDRIQLRAGRLYVNDQVVDRESVTDHDASGSDESLARLSIYRERLPDGATYLISEESDAEQLDDTQVFIVPEHHVFVLGDNRDHSADSRIDVRYVPFALLRDQPLFIYWSSDLSRIGTTIE